MSAARNPLLQATVEALAAHAPFDAMEALALRRLAARLRLGYHPRGATIIGPEGGVADRLFIVKQGQVRGTAAPDVARATADVLLGVASASRSGR